jgi:hypothetical protein
MGMRLFPRELHPMEYLPSLEQLKPNTQSPATENADFKPQWSAWSRCESSFSLLLVPHKPGVYALAEEVIDSGAYGRRMLAMFAVTASDDLARSISQLFMPSHPLCARMAQCRCFVRYAEVADPAVRQETAQALERWLLQASDRAAEMAPQSLQPVEVKEAKEAKLPEPAYFVAPQRAFLHSDFADCDPGDCTGAERRNERAARAVREMGAPAFPAGF